LVFEIFDNKLIKKAENVFKEKNSTMDTDANGNYIFAKILLKDISLHRTEKRQQEVIQKWINEEINKIL
jgi:hypothetical protein